MTLNQILSLSKAVVVLAGFGLFVLTNIYWYPIGSLLVVFLISIGHEFHIGTSRAIPTKSISIFGRSSQMIAIAILCGLAAPTVAKSLGEYGDFGFWAMNATAMGFLIASFGIFE